MEKRNKLFTKKFLDELEQKCGANTMLNHYIDDLKMSFHDAVIRFANFHDVKPEYIQKENKHVCPLLSRSKNMKGR